MNELLTISYESDNPVASARELHDALEIETPFRLWFPRMCEYGFEEGRDYTPYIFVHPRNNQDLTDYNITIDMAKEICMLQRTEKGKQCRTYFIDLEKAWNTPDQVMARALRLADKTIEDLKSKVIEMKPKADFFDQVASSKTALPMDQVAKVLNVGIGRNKLFEMLRDKKVLDRNNIPYQEFVDRGYFRVIEQKFTKPSGETQINIKTLVYQKGIDYIRKIVA